MDAKKQFAIESSIIANWWHVMIISIHSENNTILFNLQPQ